MAGRLLPVRRAVRGVILTLVVRRDRWLARW